MCHLHCQRFCYTAHWSLLLQATKRLMVVLIKLRSAYRCSAIAVASSIFPLVASVFICKNVCHILLYPTSLLFHYLYYEESQCIYYTIGFSRTFHPRKLHHASVVFNLRIYLRFIMRFHYTFGHVSMFSFTAVRI